MGAGGIPNRGVEKSYARRLEPKYKPNTRVDRYKNDKKVQSRWYDSNGKAVRNRDYEHQDAHHNHTFPHDHVWNWNGDKGIRNPDNLKPDYYNYN